MGYFGKLSSAPKETPVQYNVGKWFQDSRESWGNSQSGILISSVFIPESTETSEEVFIMLGIEYILISLCIYLFLKYAIGMDNKKYCQYIMR
jgi:hypothetical protein